MWKNGSWGLHQDNAPAYNALSVNAFLMKHKITMLEHPPYSPDQPDVTFDVEYIYGFVMLGGL